MVARDDPIGDGFAESTMGDAVESECVSTIRAAD